MTPIIGSSSITPTAAVGPRGATGRELVGPTGATGLTGSTGATGATGVHIVSGDNTTEHPNLILTLSDGTELIVENFIGPTGSIGFADGGTSGVNVYVDDVSVLKEVSSGLTFWFKGISADGSLSLYTTDDLIVVTGGSQPQESGADGISYANRFVYVSSGGTVGNSGLTFDGTMGIDFGNSVTVDIEENIIVINEILETGTWYGITGGEYISSGETAGDGKGIQLEARHGSVIKVHTPTGIAGFTGEFVDSETFGFTVILDGNYIWAWPENIYFKSDNTVFSCGEDIINFITDDGGATWNATVSSIGYGIGGEGCEGGVVPMGSCCYVDDSGNRQCIEYTTKEICDNKNEGIWNSLSTCSENCGFTADGVCCSHGGDWGNYAGTGICISGNGISECNYFSGTFLDYYYYEEAMTPDGGGFYMKELDVPVPIECGGRFPCLDINDSSCIEGEGLLKETELSNDICASPCDTTSCCKDGKCIGDSVGSTSLGSISSAACRYVYGGIPLDSGVCGEVDCCDYSVVIGACCLENLQQCIQTTHSVCNSYAGTFMGPDSNCDNDPCCYRQPLGLCCLSNESCNCCGSILDENKHCCQNKTQSDCHIIGGTWQVGTCPEPGNSSCQCGKHENCEIDLGACCVNFQTCIDDLSQQSCNELGGSWLGPRTVCSIGGCRISCTGNGDPGVGCPSNQCCLEDPLIGGRSCQPCNDCVGPDCLCLDGGPPPCIDTPPECSGPGSCPPIMNPGGMGGGVTMCCCNGFCEPCPCGGSPRGCCCYNAGHVYASCTCGVFEVDCADGGGTWRGDAGCSPAECQVIPNTYCCCGHCFTYYPEVMIPNLGDDCSVTCQGGTIQDGTQHICGCSSCDDCPKLMQCLDCETTGCCEPPCSGEGQSLCDPAGDDDDETNCCGEHRVCCGNKCCCEEQCQLTDGWIGSEEVCCNNDAGNWWDSQCCDSTPIIIEEEEVYGVCCNDRVDPWGNPYLPFCCEAGTVCCGGGCIPHDWHCCQTCYGAFHGCPEPLGHNTACCGNSCAIDCEEGMYQCCISGNGNVMQFCGAVIHCRLAACCAYNNHTDGQGNTHCDACCTDPDISCPPGECYNWDDNYEGYDPADYDCVADDPSMCCVYDDPPCGPPGMCPPNCDPNDPPPGDPPQGLVGFDWYMFNGECSLMTCPEPCAYERCQQESHWDGGESTDRGLEVTTKSPTQRKTLYDVRKEKYNPTPDSPAYSPSVSPEELLGYEPNVSCPADINHDGVVGITDVLTWVSLFGQTCNDDQGPGCMGDVNRDGVVDVADLLEIIDHWGPCADPQYQYLLQASDGSNNDYFGHSVALSNNAAVVGAWGEDSSGGFASGAAYIFRLEYGVWTEESKIVAVGTDPQIADAFGGYVDIHGDVALIAAHGDDEGGQNAGAVYIFRRDTSGLVPRWIQEIKILGDSPGDNLGSREGLSVWGDSALVTSEEQTGVGYGHIYNYDGSNWIKEHTIVPFGGGAWGSGESSMSENLIAIGNAAGNGAVWVWRFNGTQWVEEQRIISPEDTFGENERFGFSVSIEGNILVVGAPWDEDLGEYTGAVYMYHFDGSQWNFEKKFIGRMPGNRFGFAVSVSGETVVVSSPYENEQRGYAQSFRRVSTNGDYTWIEEQLYRLADPSENDFYGYSVSVDGDTILIGAYGDAPAQDLRGPQWAMVPQGTASVFHGTDNTINKSMTAFETGGFKTAMEAIKKSNRFTDEQRKTILEALNPSEGERAEKLPKKKTRADIWKERKDSWEN